MGEKQVSEEEVPMVEDELQKRGWETANEQFVIEKLVQNESGLFFLGYDINGRGREFFLCVGISNGKVESYFGRHYVDPNLVPAFPGESEPWEDSNG